MIGRFDLVKPVRLVDIDALAAIEATGSFFDPTYIDRLERAKFLRTLSLHITRPILPDDELSEYLVTQAISDFLATELKFDGVIYRSAQAKGGTNVALFHHATHVEDYELPQGSLMKAYTDEIDEEGARRNFTVFEEVPSPSEPQPNKPRQEEVFDWSASEEAKVVPYLKLDFASIVVCEIQAVDYSWKEYEVHRTRFEKRPGSDF